MSLRVKIITIIIAIGLALIAIFMKGLYGGTLPNPSSETNQTSSPTPQAEIKSDKPKLVSTKPENLKEGTIVTSSQVIEITFSHPIENKGEVKRELDPNLPYKVELSSDRKTVLLMPDKLWETGKGYTFTVKRDTKFDGGLRMENDQTFHFNTITYQGI